MFVVDLVWFFFFSLDLLLFLVVVTNLAPNAQGWPLFQFAWFAVGGRKILWKYAKNPTPHITRQKHEQKSGRLWPTSPQNNED